MDEIERDQLVQRAELDSAHDYRCSQGRDINLRCDCLSLNVFQLIDAGWRPPPDVEQVKAVLLQVWHARAETGVTGSPEDHCHALATALVLSDFGRNP